MRLGRPLAAASAVAAMTGASLIASPALANSSNRNSPSSSSSPAPSSTAEATPAPSSTAEATPAPGKTSEGSSFKITQEKTFVSASTNTSFTVSGTGCTGKQATVGIALYAPDGTVSDVVKTNAASDGSWTSDLDLAALIKSIGSSAATTTDGWTIGAGCMTSGDKGDKTETAQVTTQQQTKIYFDDTRISGSYEVSARTESESQTFTFNAQGFYASEKVTVLLKSKSDSSISYTLGELTVDANGNLTGNLPAPTDAPDGEYLLVLTGSHHSETATSQTVTTVSNHTFTVESTENNGGGDKQANGGGGDKTASEQKATEQQNTEQKATEQQNTEQKASEQQKTEQKASEQQNTEQKASEQQNTEQKATEQKASEQQKTEQQKTEQQNTEQQKTEQQKTEQKASEQQNTEQQKTEQKASEQQKATEQQNSEQQKASEQKASENNGGGNKQANGGGDKTVTEQQKATEQQKTEQKTSENNGGGNNGGSNSNANASENKGGADQKVNDLNSNAKESSSDNRAGGETTKDSDRSLAHTGANGLIFGGIAVFLAVAGGAALLLRRRNKA